MKPWVKLYRDERGSFAQLPLLTRAVAAELLKLTDDDGAIDLGRRGDDPAGAICFALGAERNERRAVKRHIDLLLADGYLSHDPANSRLLVPGFAQFQGSKRSHPKRAQRDTTAPRESTVSDSSVSRERVVRDLCAPPLEANSPESLNTGLGDKSREEKKRGRETRARSQVSQDGADLGRPRRHAADYMGQPADQARSALNAALVEVGATPKSRGGFATQEAWRQVACCADEVAASLGQPFEHVLQVSARGFVAVKGADGHPKWWAEDVGRYHQAGLAVPAARPELTRLEARRDELIQRQQFAPVDEKQRIEAELQRIAREIRSAKRGAA